MSELWPQLARDCGLDLVTIATLAEMDERAFAATLVAGAGQDDQVEELLNGLSSKRDIAVVSASTDHRVALDMLRAGASEYFALPDDLELLRTWMRERAVRFTERESRDGFVAAQHAKYDFREILGASGALQAALTRAARIIPHADVTVLLTGETGTGKELVARAIHYNGPRRDAPFVDINCAAIPEQLLESELFGHEKGSFTGATATKPGLFEVAHRGTLFLDEIAHLALPLQGKLLRALEERQIRRVGGTRTLDVNVRVIAATHVNLQDAVRDGRFREDLYYRVNVVPIELPPLRVRQGDIALLAEHFLHAFARQYGVPAKSLARKAMEMLLEHSWPGNVRELRNAMERALLLAPGAAIDAQDLQLHGTARESSLGSTTLVFPASADALLRSAARAMVYLSGGNKSRAARRLDISRARLLRLLDAAQSDLADSSSDADDLPSEDP